MLAPLLAEIVTVSPVVPPVADMVGVLSLVLLSVLDDPVSDPLARSGVDGADGAVRSRVNDGPSTFDAGPLTPDESITEPDARRGVTVPSGQLEIEIVKVVEVPVVGVVLNAHPLPPAAFEKSAPDTLVASIAEPKVSV